MMAGLALQSGALLAQTTLTSTLRTSHNEAERLDDPV